MNLVVNVMPWWLYSIKGSRAWLVINTIAFIFIADFDILGHILMSKLQYVPGLSPGMPWPAAIYDVMTGCNTTYCVISRVLSAFEDCPSSSSTLTLLANLPQQKISSIIYGLF